MRDFTSIVNAEPIEIARFFLKVRDRLRFSAFISVHLRLPSSKNAASFRIAGLSVHASRLARAITFGAWKFGGKITHFQRFGSSSATCSADFNRVGLTSIVLGTGLPSAMSIATSASERRNPSGGT